MNIMLCINIYLYTTHRVHNNDVNDAETRLLVIDAEPRLSLSEKKRARAELRL